MVGHQAWTRIFAGDPAALGKTVDVDGQPVTVVGVMRPEFGGLDDYPRDIWMPSADRDPKREVQITVRLRPDVVPAQAEARLSEWSSA